MVAAASVGATDVHIDASQSPALFRLASERLNATFKPELDHKILTAISPSGVIAQAVFTDIVVGLRAELSLWANPVHGLWGRQLIRQVCKTAFIDFRCKRLHACTRVGNRQAQATLQKMGFVIEAHMERWYPDDDGLMFKMMLPNCRWLAPKRETNTDC